MLLHWYLMASWSAVSHLSVMSPSPGATPCRGLFLVASVGAHARHTFSAAGLWYKKFAVGFTLSWESLL